MKKLSIVQMEEVMGGSVHCRLLAQAFTEAMAGLQIAAAGDILRLHAEICPSN